MPLVKRLTSNVPEALKPDVSLSSQITTQIIPSEAATKVVKETERRAPVDDKMSKADWAAKDKRISRQGLFQAALQSVGILQLNTGNTLDDYLKLVEEVAERGLQFVARE